MTLDTDSPLLIFSLEETDKALLLAAVLIYRNTSEMLLSSFILSYFSSGVKGYNRGGYKGG